MCVGVVWVEYLVGSARAVLSGWPAVCVHPGYPGLPRYSYRSGVRTRCLLEEGHGTGRAIIKGPWHPVVIENVVFTKDAVAT